MLAFAISVVANAAILTPEVPISTPNPGPAPNSQFLPAVATNGSDFFATWTDNRFNGKDIFGTPITRDGRVGDANGIPLRPSGWDDHVSDVVWNGTSYIVVFQSDNIGVNAVDVLPTGQILGNLAIVVPRWVFDVRMAWSGNVYLLTWSEPERPGIHARVFDSDLHAVGEELYFGNGWRPVVASNGSGFLVAWNYSEGQTWASKFALVSTSGVAGAPVTFTNRTTLQLALASNGVDYLLMHGGSQESEVLSVSSSGAITRRIEMGWVTEPALAWDGLQYVAAWSTQTRLYGATFDGGGMMTRGPWRVLDRDTYQSQPAIAGNANAILLTWQELGDIRSATFDPKSYADQTAAATSTALVSTGPTPQVPLDAVWTGSKLNVAWREGDLDTHLFLNGTDLGRGNQAALAANGSTLAIATITDNRPFVRVGNGAPQQLDTLDAQSIAIAGDGSDFAAFWPGGGFQFTAVRAAKIGGETRTIAMNTGNQFHKPVAVVWTGSEYALIVAGFHEHLPRLKYFLFYDVELYLVRLDRSLNAIAPPVFLESVPFGGENYHVALATSGRDLLLVWNTTTTPATLFSRHYAFDGTPIGAATTLATNEYIGNARAIWNGSAYLVAAGNSIWEDGERTTIANASNIVVARGAIVYARPVAMQPLAPLGTVLRAVVRYFAAPKFRAAGR